MKKTIMWVLIAIVANLGTGCEYLLDSNDNADELSMTINAPSFGLRNRYYIDVCNPTLFSSKIHEIDLFVDPDLHFELQISQHTLESKRDKDPIAELWILAYMEEAIEINKKYHFRNVGDYETATDYSFAGATLKLNDRTISSSDGWVRFTQIKTKNGEEFSIDNSDIIEVRGEFAFTGELDGSKVEVSEGQFVTKSVY